MRHRATCRATLRSTRPSTTSSRTRTATRTTPTSSSRSRRTRRRMPRATSSARTTSPRPSSIPFSAIMANDTHSGGTIIGVTGGVGGTVALDMVNHAVLFTPTAFALPNGSFSYILQNSDGSVDAATVNITGVNAQQVNATAPGQILIGNDYALYFSISGDDQSFGGLIDADDEEIFKWNGSASASTTAAVSSIRVPAMRTSTPCRSFRRAASSSRSPETMRSSTAWRRCSRQRRHLRLVRAVGHLVRRGHVRPWRRQRHVEREQPELALPVQQRQPGHVVQRRDTTRSGRRDTYQPYELVLYNVSTNSFSEFANGMLSSGVIDAVDVLANGNVIFSLAADTTLGGTLYEDSDLIRWNGSSYSKYFDGSDNGLSTRGREHRRRVDPRKRHPGGRSGERHPDGSWAAKTCSPAARAPTRSG